jgi:cobalt-zinc-cadmium efflux system outer membrane protein
MKCPRGVRRDAGTHTLSFVPGLIALAIALPTLSWAQASTPPGAPQSTPGAASAGSAPTLTLEQAIDLALNRHPDLSVARREVEAALGATQQAGVLPNPSLSMSVEDTRKTTRTTAYQLSQLIELGGKRSSRVKAAQLMEDLNRAQVQGRVVQIRASVRTGFWDLLAAQSRMDLARQSEELAQAAVDAASKRVAAGKVSPVEETRARLALSGVGLETAQAQQDLVAAKSRLGAMLGIAPEQLPQPAGELRAPGQAPTPSELTRYMTTAPETVQSELEVKRRDALVEVERSRAVPDVTVGVGMQRNNEMGRNQTLLGVSIPLPVFDRNQGNLREAIARADQARDDARSRQMRLMTDVQVAAGQLETARRQVFLAEEKLLPDASRTYEAATQGFALGKFGFLDVLDAQRTLFQARSQHLKALSDAQKAAADLESLLGASVSSQVGASNGTAPINTSSATQK